MDFVQGVSVSGNLRFVMVQRSAVLIDNGGNTFVAGHNALYSIGAFDRLHLCDGFQFRENLRVLLLAYACHGFQRRNIRSKVYKVCRQQAIIQK